MNRDDIPRSDIINLLKCGAEIQFPKFETTTWRRYDGNRVYVVDDLTGNVVESGFSIHDLYNLTGVYNYELRGTELSRRYV